MPGLDARLFSFYPLFMEFSSIIGAPIVLLPVLIFLMVLRYMDSYQLVAIRLVLVVIAAGGVVAIASYFVNTFILQSFSIEFGQLTRYVSPVVEEALKGAIIIWLLYRRRIGFLVDAAIFGFATGAGFALVENLYYLQLELSDNPGVWIVRGLGTAIMHGGVTAIFAIVCQSMTERRMHINPFMLLPGLIAAISLHSAFNHFFLSPILHTVIVLIFLPPIFYAVFQKSSNALHDWMQLDFDEDANLLAQINSGEFTQSKMGRFLSSLQTKFEGPMVVDMLCYLRLYTELALRAKGILMMREHGIRTTVDAELKAMLVELKHLERSIGKLGIITLSPYLHYSRKDSWQMTLLQ